MAYATPDQLAKALNTKVTPANTPVLEACLEAAANEIDDALDRIEPLPEPVDARVERTNVNRACEWYKAPDAANGGVGTDQIGTLETPASGFDRHKATIIGLKQRWGVG